MSVFEVGHRVVVKPGNGYDKPNPSEFGLMAGHYGKVTEVTVGEIGIVTVHVTGHVSGKANPYVMELDAEGRKLPAEWLFFPHELEHTD